MKERDTVILPVRIKIELKAELDERVAKLKVSRNSFMIRAIKELLRPHKKKELNVQFKICGRPIHKSSD